MMVFLNQIFFKYYENLGIYYLLYYLDIHQKELKSIQPLFLNPGARLLFVGRSITIQIIIISVLDYLSNFNPENRNNNHHFCWSQHNWRPSTSVNGRFISARLRLMLLGWPKRTDAGWTTPIDARRLDGRVRQTDGAQPYRYVPQHECALSEFHRYSHKT